MKCYYCNGDYRPKYERVRSVCSHCEAELQRGCKDRAYGVQVQESEGD